MTDARDVTLSLRGRWHGSYGSAHCPVCQPQHRRDQAALSLADGQNGRLLLRCFKSGCAFSEILAALGIGTGDYQPPSLEEIQRREREAQHEAQRRALAASSIWRETVPIEGTPAERYLRGRGITCRLPDHLRFHPRLRHPSGSLWRAMVAAVTQPSDSAPAIHRTYLLPDGSGKAPVEPAKLMLGACAGGHVAVATGGPRLVVAEGIETALSLASGLLAESATIWAALSTSGMRSLILPPEPGELIIAEDADDAGRGAADHLAARAAAAGWRVLRLSPPEGCSDFNDILRGVAAA